MKQAPIIPLLKFENAGLPFKIQSLKSAGEEQDELSESPHSHNYYEMTWIVNGQGTLHVDLQEYTIENNMFFCLRPNQAHKFQTSPNSEGYVLSFTEGFFNMAEHEFDWTIQASMFQLFSKSQVIRIQNEMEPDLIAITQKMVKEFENLYSFRAQLLKRYFRIFLIYLTRQFEDSLQPLKQNREMELVNSFLGMLEKEFKEKKMVADYAMQLSVTPNYLNGIVKRNTNYSAGQLIRQRVVLEAKRMARYSDAGMKEIAYSLGFSDSGHFSKFFKAVSGMNFSDFKKEGLTVSMEESLGRA
jgi:AraC family transcriptional regulator, transcriptional activator of pobA